MSNLSNLISNIATSEIDFKSPISEELLTKFRDNVVLALAAIAGDSNNLLKGVIDADPPNAVNSYITDADPTNGTISRDDKFNGLHIKFTSGTIFTGNQFNRYKITDTDAALSRITVAENLYAAGARLGDTYEVVGHTHGALDYPADKDGEFISMRSLVNMLEKVRLSQNDIDALTDPTSARIFTASKTNPFATLQHISTNFGRAVVFMDTDAVTVGLNQVITKAHGLGFAPSVAEFDFMVQNGTAATDFWGHARGLLRISSAVSRWVGMRAQHNGGGASVVHNDLASDIVYNTQNLVQPVSDNNGDLHLTVDSVNVYLTWRNASFSFRGFIKVL